MPPQSTSTSRLDDFIDRCPIIDNHAHPLLKPEHLSKYPLLSISSEAHGDALADHPNSLPHLRATKILAGLLDCKNSWEDVEGRIKEIRANAEESEKWMKRCLGGIETLLLDDGLDEDEVHGYSWHDRIVVGQCKRIVRIEALAGEIIRRHCDEFSKSSSNRAAECVDPIVREFVEKIAGSVKDPEVVGFKSVICYRSGLDIQPRKDLEMSKVWLDLVEILEHHRRTKTAFTKLRHRHVGQHFVRLTAMAIADGKGTNKKPFQFHTGLGDNDITLTRSSPSHLQDFIRDYPTVPIVLLHGGYPWTREMGYLAASYANVYADIGEVFPIVSRHGQEGILKQILEICPWSKILWSTDGHWFPETYVLATIQARDVFKSVIGDFLCSNDLDEKQAIKLVEDIFYNNSNRLYSLNLRSPQMLPSPNTAIQASDNTMTALQRKVAKFEPRWLRVYWHDYTSSVRCKLIPMKEVYKKLEAGSDISIDITQASLGMLPIDMAAPGVTGTGMYRLRVDWDTLRAGPAQDHLSCFGKITEFDGSSVSLCPRALLQRTLDRSTDAGLSFLMGFEIEFVVMQRVDSQYSKYKTLSNDGHAWAMSRALADWGRDESFNTAADEILDLLHEADISVEQFHAESAPGQYEVVMPPLSPMEACDTLLHAKQIIESVAARHGFRVTLHPKPFPQNCGTASHMHLSINSERHEADQQQQVWEPFYAGVLSHLRGIIAFTYSNPVSYERMVDSFWAGGRWVTWGTQNKETPLRKCQDSHWEIKVIDGLANPYFVAAAVISAGLDGIQKYLDLSSWKDCLGDPAKMADEERKASGITEMFPANLHEALEALAHSEVLREHLGDDFVDRYTVVKQAEINFLKDMSPDDRREWILERY